MRGAPKSAAPCLQGRECVEQAPDFVRILKDRPRAFRRPLQQSSAPELQNRPRRSQMASRSPLTASRHLSNQPSCSCSLFAALLARFRVPKPSQNDPKRTPKGPHGVPIKQGVLRRASGEVFSFSALSFSFFHGASPLDSTLGPMQNTL